MQVIWESVNGSVESVEGLYRKKEKTFYGCLGRLGQQKKNMNEKFFKCLLWVLKACERKEGKLFTRVSEALRSKKKI